MLLLLYMQVMPPQVLLLPLAWPLAWPLVWLQELVQELVRLLELEQQEEAGAERFV